MIVGVIASALAGYGVFLLYTAAALGWRGAGLGPGPQGRRRRWRSRRWTGDLAGGDAAELAVSMAGLGVAGAAVGYILFGGVLPAAVAGAFAASAPIASLRARRRRRRATAAEAWPRLLEELRLLTGSAGRSIPQALFDVGRRAPPELRRGFALAEREWLLTTDFERTTEVLKEQLADPTADAVCETLVVAHEVGGGGLDQRLAELVDDRLIDQQGRKDAISKLAGVRFARRFVLLVPLGMAVAGLSIGSGRAAYETTGGQIAVVVGLLAIVACWVWSGRLMRIPEEPRVFGSTGVPAGSIPPATSSLREADTRQAVG